MSGTIVSIYQRGKSRTLTRDDLVAALSSQLVPVEHLTVISRWMGYPTWTLSFKTSKDGALNLMFWADTRYFNPPEDMQEWVADNIQQYLPATWTLIPKQKPRIIDVAYRLVLEVLITPPDNSSGFGVG